MSTGVKYLIGAAVLIVGVLFCAAIFTTTNKGRSSTNKSMEAVDDLLGQYDDIEFSVYADTTASGSDIINLIKNLDSSDGVSIQVQNKSATVTYAINASGAVEGTAAGAGGAGGGATYSLAAISDKTQTAAYINSLATFEGSLVRDANGAITQVNFVQR